MADFDGFEFIVTEEEDLFLVIYARSGNPENPTIKLDMDKKQVALYRNPTDIVFLDEVAENIFEILKEESALLITEVIPTDNPLEHEIKQVYNAKIVAD